MMDDGPFDLAELVTRCATTPLSPADRATEAPTFTPTSDGLRDAAQDYANARTSPSTASAPSAGCGRDDVQPFVLRRWWAANLAGFPSIPAVNFGSPASRTVISGFSWWVPRGRCYRTTRCRFNCWRIAEACAGFILYRDDKVWFDGSGPNIVHPNGTATPMPFLSQTSVFYSRDTDNDRCNHVVDVDFPTVFRPGEKLTIDFVVYESGLQPISLNVALSGCLLPADTP